MNLDIGCTRLLIGKCGEQHLLRNQVAYLLATAWHETGHTMRPIHERGAVSYFYKYEPGTSIGRRLGNTNKGDGYLFRGRGFVQITGRRNYQFSSTKLGADFVGNPELVLDPNHAADIIVLGMKEGWFTGKKLADYVTLQQSLFIPARRIINGTDCASLIAGYAVGYDAALKAVGYGS
ncbi:carboxypeptidase [Mesorhizobium sp. BR-1-1-8]|uniref:glycoside hydrolase family 19 protein n=1 Tax=Mesorhizobium sp. BR-1-1-8 TaxID=2876659 RepID=UPI001CCD2746|nr:glycoside hydrolase family 19 protein [Mesorhizobium sp. BR-1-1-8]MBZ9984917.1 carboxypeptidase [Mesorhizobium sp. BR-1-1-8]